MSDKKDSGRRRVVVEEVNSGPDVVIEETILVSEPLIKNTPQEEPQNMAPIQEPVSVPQPQTVTPDSPSSDYEYVQRRGPSPLVVIVPGVLLLGALLGGIVFYQNSLNKTDNNVIEPTVAPIESIVPTATPTSSSVDTTKYSIAIQNGSGIKGEAGKVQDILEDAKFKVSTTGNAANYDYTETVIQAKSTIDKEFLDKLTEVLSETYKVKSKTEPLSSTSKDEVIVIVGSSKN